MLNDKVFVTFVLDQNPPDSPLNPIQLELKMFCLQIPTPNRQVLRLGKSEKFLYQSSDKSNINLIIHIHIFFLMFTQTESQIECSVTEYV